MPQLSVCVAKIHILKNAFINGTLLTGYTLESGNNVSLVPGCFQVLTELDGEFQMAFYGTMIKSGLALAVAGLTLAATIAPAEAQWRRFGHHRGFSRGGVAAAAIGGLAAGAIIAGVSRPAYAAPVYGYQSYAAPVYGYSYDDGSAYYGAPAYATPTYYAPARPAYRRHVYRQHAAYHEPVCRITRKRVWLGPNTYTFKRSTVCR